MDSLKSCAVGAEYNTVYTYIYNNLKKYNKNVKYAIKICHLCLDITQFLVMKLDC